MGRMGEAGRQVQASSYRGISHGGERCSRGHRVNGTVIAWGHMAAELC